MFTPLEKVPSPQEGPFTTFWLVAWALVMAFSWILPNHYYPWAGFHMDVVMACVLLAASLWLIGKDRAPTPFTALPLIAFMLLMVIALQYATGLVRQAGNAWLSTAYVLGFICAWAAGNRWARIGKWQAADGLFLAIGIAAFLSVGLQLHQWLQLDRLDIWSMGGGESRPYANMGQPNQLGTLLLWGALALFWGLVRSRVRASVATLGIAFLLFGVALTLSRTAWLGLALLLIMMWCWRDRWPGHKAPWVASALGVYFVACIFFVRWIPHALWGDSPDWADIAGIGSTSRPALWALFVDAAKHAPWFGYGWNQTGLAHIAMALNHPPLFEYFQSAHNFFLDLVLWCGLPIGVAVSSYLIWWIVASWRRVKTPEDRVLWLFLLVVANHAMLELPLYYAYFLLPVGLVMGLLDVQLGSRPLFFVGWKANGLILAVAAALLILLIRDYSGVEKMYVRLRYQWAGIQTDKISPPDVILLTQWRDFFRVTQQDPTKKTSEEEMALIHQTVSLNPNSGFFQLLAIAWAQRGEPEKAAQALDTMCSILTPAVCNSVKRFWIHRAQYDAVVASVPWPRKN
jgi:hypothetical protein